jgi:hypothetical protein
MPVAWFISAYTSHMGMNTRSIRQTAEILGFEPRTVRRMIKQGDLTAIPIRPWWPWRRVVTLQSIQSQRGESKGSFDGAALNSVLGVTYGGAINEAAYRCETGITENYCWTGAAEYVITGATAVARSFARGTLGPRYLAK